MLWFIAHDSFLSIFKIYILNHFEYHFQDVLKLLAEIRMHCSLLARTPAVKPAVVELPFERLERSQLNELLENPQHGQRQPFAGMAETL